MDKNFEIKTFEFNESILSDEEFYDSHITKANWPIVYLLRNNQVAEAYVGETTNSLSRLQTHLKNKQKKRLSLIEIITSEYFNKSATLDVESNLIKYIAADGRYKLQNANIGIANHNYYQKNDLYKSLFKEIWDKLRALGIVKHSIEFIDNSDLFKYSPYKSLSVDQFKAIISLLEAILIKDKNQILVKGTAGTGKTILALFLMKLLNTDIEDIKIEGSESEQKQLFYLIKEFKKLYPSHKIAIVIPMSSFRKTIQKVCKNIKGLKSNMVISPSEVAKSKYDILIVDEAHRLRKRNVLGTYFGTFDNVCNILNLNKDNATELDWVKQQSKKAIFFYDKNQSIKPSDIDANNFDKLENEKDTLTIELQSQMRVLGGSDYIKYINKLLTVDTDNIPQFRSSNYELLFFESFAEMYSEIKRRNNESGLSRIISGYSWEWKSKKYPHKYDIEIENIKLRWNSVTQDWINTTESVDEVGCIHTTQGYDLNYAGIIFGKEIDYDPKTQSIVIFPDEYKDKNGKMTIKDPETLKTYILNIYKTMMYRGIQGTYVYACNDNLKNYLKQYIPSFISLKRHEEKIYSLDLNLKNNEQSIPLYNFTALAGGFGENYQSEILQYIPLPSEYKNSENYFACKITGESMNLVIPNNSICLFKKYTGGTRNGMIVLAELIDIYDKDTHSQFTVKEYYSEKLIMEDEWTHTKILLKPLSSDETYVPIEIDSDNSEAVKIIGIFEKVLYKE